jgi:hypothetical protein
MIRLTPGGVVTIICRTEPVAAAETAAAVRARISAAGGRAEALFRAWVLVSRAQPITRPATVTPTATPSHADERCLIPPRRCPGRVKLSARNTRI